MSDSRLHIYEAIGALRIGQFDCRCGDMANCGAATIAAGINPLATGEGATAYGRAERPGGVLASGNAACACGISKENGVVVASGSASLASGYASGGGRVNAAGEESLAVGTATNNGEIRAAGTAAQVYGVADTNGQILSDGDAAIARGTAALSGVIKARGKASTAIGSAIEGLIEADGDASVATGEVSKNGRIVAVGKGSRAEGLCGGGGGSGGGEQSAIVASAPFSHAAGISLGQIEASGAFSHAEGAAGAGQTVVAKGAFSHAVGMNLSVTGSYSHALGQHGILDAFLPSFGVFAGIDSASLPSVALMTDAVGSQPLGYGAAAGWRSAVTGFKEIFAWRDGNPKEEDRCGLFVALKEGKLIRANGSDAIGVTSDMYGFVAGTGISLRCDKFGRPLLRPDFTYGLNAELLRRGFPPYAGELIPTEAQARVIATQLGLPQDTPLKKSFIVETDETKELLDSTQQAVILIGKAIVTDMGECKRSTCGCEYGLAVPGDRWRILRRVSETTIEILLC